MTNKYYTVQVQSIVKAPSKTVAGALVLGEALEDSGEILKSETIVEVLEHEELHKEFVESTVIEDDIQFDLSYDSTLPKETIDFLRNENRRLVRLVEKHKNIKLEAVDAIYKAAYDAFNLYDKPEVPKITADPFLDGLVPVVAFADFQLGKVTESYNSNVCAKRIAQYAQKAGSLIEHMKSLADINHLRIWLLGDIVEGEEIFPGQSFLIDSGLYRQVGIYGPEIITSFIDSMLEIVDTIQVTGVIGNHGSLGGKNRKLYDPETNMDRLLYKIVELVYRDNERVSFNIPDGRGERNFYAVDEIGNYSALLVHGDQFGPPNSNYGYFKKIMGWKDGAIKESFDDLYCGHWHQEVKMTLGSTIVRVLPSPESDNTFAQEVLGAKSIHPAQNLYFIDPHAGKVFSEHNIWLD